MDLYCELKCFASDFTFCTSGGRNVAGKVTMPMPVS